MTKINYQYFFFGGGGSGIYLNIIIKTDNKLHIHANKQGHRRQRETRSLVCLVLHD
jgi:hypothetical protein